MASTILDPIRAEIRELTSTIDSNKALLQKLMDKILAAPTLAEAKAIAQEIKDQKEELAADVVANTPAEDESTEQPTNETGGTNSPNTMGT